MVYVALSQNGVVYGPFSRIEAAREWIAGLPHLRFEIRGPYRNESEALLALSGDMLPQSRLMPAFQPRKAA
jgi:hypothetical protein